MLLSSDISTSLDFYRILLRRCHISIKWYQSLNDLFSFLVANHYFQLLLVNLSPVRHSAGWGARGGGGGQKSTFFLAKTQNKSATLFRPFCPHRKFFCGVLQRSNYPSIMIRQSFRFIFLYISLNNTLTIIFSQREGSVRVASIKAVQQPILSNCCSILAEEGQESEFKCIDY